MNIRYHVELTEAERCELTALLNGGKHSARKLKRAQILLAADSGVSRSKPASALVVPPVLSYQAPFRRRRVGGGAERTTAAGR